MREDKIETKLSILLHRFQSEALLFLCGITDAAQLDVAQQSLKKHFPGMVSDETIAWMREGIVKWGGKLHEQFPKEFLERFPRVGKTLRASDGNKLIFLRMAEFCGADPAFLAEQVEALLRVHDEGRQYIIWNGLHDHFESWADLPHNAKCFVISTIAYYTQMQCTTFRKVFLPEAHGGGGGGAGGSFVYIDWRSDDEREELSIPELRRRDAAEPMLSVAYGVRS